MATSMQPPSIHVDLLHLADTAEGLDDHALLAGSTLEPTDQDLELNRRRSLTPPRGASG
jgi:hypothetical protein